MKHHHARFLALASLAAWSCGDDKAATGTDDTDQPGDVTADTGAGDSTGGDLETVGFDTEPADTTTSPPDTTGGEVGSGQFGAPCQGNIDCVDGYCVEGPEGFVCTKGCETECPGGFDCRGVQSGSADTIFLCLPRVARVCVPCKADYQCPNGACLELGGSSQCSFGCDANADCPSGYECGNDPAATHAGKFCLPKSGSCDCTPDLAGAVRTCTSTNDFGTCYGVESCDANAGWVGCSAPTAMAEICDGRDNDCDALVDDGVETNTPCENTVAGVGTCRGVSVCVGTQGLVCTAQTPEVEACDFRDNDCDGEIDEDFKDANGEFSLPEHCGTCNSDCSEKIANGTGTCEVVAGASPVCVVAACDPDYVELNRFQCALPPDVSCLPCAGEDECYDGSCVELDGQKVCVVPCGDSGSCQDGYACEDVAGEQRCVPVSNSCLCNPTTDGQIRTCVRSSVSGTCYGQETCNATAGWSGCTARNPGEEVCNGIDDDCSSAVDDVLGRGNACALTNGFGTCAGVQDCGSATALECIGHTPAAETCNYEDDDCDGQTDESYAGLYASCSSGQGACQRYGFVECKADGSGTQCNAVAGLAGSETCDRLDNDCDGATDETYPDLGAVCFTGVGACAGAGTKVCAAAGNGTLCNAVATAPSGEDCDLLDNDCDGVTDNGFKNASGAYDTDTTCGNCFTDCTAIYARPNGGGRCGGTTAEPQCALVCNNGYFNLNEVPDDGCEFGLDAGAIYVGTDSLGATDDANCGLGPVGTGTGNHPCNTITFGLTRAQALTRSKVIVADGLYSEQVTLLNGISVLGGYRSDTWDRHLSSTGTTVRGPDGTGDRKAIVAIDITTTTVVEGLVVNAANAISTGANSYGIYIRNATGALQIKNNLIFAGLGGPGSTGTIGTSGENGVGGIVGLSTKHLTACTTSPNNVGGAGGVKSCQNPGLQTTTLVSGGKGGDSVCPLKGRQEGAGVTGLNGGGAGGAGGWGHNSSTSGCSPSSEGPETGVPGIDAAVQASRDGNGGAGCSDNDGFVSNDEWRGAAASDGVHGQHGGGGGGGGAGSGGVLSSSSYDISGSGGGGGSGGCAGWLGGGGIPGGGSFGVFVYWSPGNLPSSAAGVPSIASNVISRNQGGPGGNGGNGGAGGDPGPGALGGPLGTGLSSPLFCVFGGAKGGFGARGGHGGGGGGGCGGASFDIFAWGINGQTNNFASNTFANGQLVTGGVPGAGGNSSNTTKGGTTGTAGASGTIRIVD